MTSPRQFITLCPGCRRLVPGRAVAQRLCVECRARRAHIGRRKRGMGEHVRIEDKSILRLDPCSYCGLPGGTVDHIVPRFAGGDSASGNLTGACRACQVEKGATSLLIYLAERV